MIAYQFEGERIGNFTPYVTLNGEALDFRLDLMRHSPCGFEWGYSGSGPHQLSLAILSVVFGDKVALKLYGRFAREVISRLDRDSRWGMSERNILEWYRSTIKLGR